MVNASYKTITYNSTAAELDLNTWYSNGPTNVNASKIILSDNLTWDIKWQIGVFAKQELVFDGNGYTITLAKDTGGAGTSPVGFSGLFCIGDESSYSSSIADSDDYYGLHVKNFILDSEANSIPLRLEHNSTHRYIGYVFGKYYNRTNVNAWGPHGRATDDPPGIARVTPSTKNTFICEKVEVKGYFTSDLSMLKWFRYKNHYDSNNNARTPSTCGAFVGSVSGRAKFLNCIANGKFIGESGSGYIEFVNCLTTNNSYMCGDAINRHNTTSSYHKWIFENCVAFKLFGELYNGTTHPDITANGGKILEISGCKVDQSEYWRTAPWSGYLLEQNSTKNFDYLDNGDPFQSMRISALDNVLAVIGGAFKKSNNTITFQFSPYAGIEIGDVLAVKSIDLSGSDTVSSSAIPTTWFNNLSGSGETLERNKETRRNNLITEIFTANATKTFFDISSSAINASNHSVKESTRIFKVDTNTNKATLNLNTNTDLGEKKGFYVPLTADNQKVDITSKDGNITFQIERTGTDGDGKAIYSLKKTAGNSNLIIDS